MDYLIKYVACYIFELWIQGFSFKLHNTKRVLFPQSFQMEISNYAEIRKSLKMHPKNVQQVKTKKERKPKKWWFCICNTEVTSMMQGSGMFSHIPHP